MRSWISPEVPVLQGESVPLSLYDTADKKIKPVEGDGLYVCGITPYDSTHLGHAATYVTFDVIHRMMRDNGSNVTYVQNITDVDDPLFERAERDGVDWKDLGDSQIDLFRSDMTNLRVIAPHHYIGVMEAIDEIIVMVQKLLDNGSAYFVNDDIYASITATEQFGYESNYDRATMETLFAERGGDPDTPGKRDPLDALIWKAEREGEPSWPSPFGPGRPGWHIECSAIALNRLGTPFAVQGGGSDLIFPHHEFSAAHAEATTGHPRMANHYVHTGMIGLDGTKMSKSLGNLVFVHKLDAEPATIRLGIYSSHYRQDRDWSEEVLEQAQSRLKLWRSGTANVEATQEFIHKLRLALANDLDTPKALEVVDEWAASGDNDPEAKNLMSTALDALLGVQL